MSPQEYIETGILERYVLGDVSEQERQQVSCMSSIYPEVREELESLEAAMGKYSTAFSLEPRASMKDTILAAMKEAGQDAGGDELKKEKSGAVDESVVVPIQKSSSKFTPLMVAASLVLLIVSASIYFILSDQLNAAQEKTAVLESERDQLNAELNEANAVQEQLAFDLSIINSANTQRVSMKGVGEHTEALATVYWDASTNNTYLATNNLPVPPSGKQYQLWAIVEGTPVDMGVFDVDGKSSDLQEMKIIEQAQAFAVTLEDEGGKPTPTLEQMYVLGNVGT